MDIQMTYKYMSKPALKKKTVLRTWSGTLKDEQNLPCDWTRKEVLVGRRVYIKIKVPQTLRVINNTGHDPP